MVVVSSLIISALINIAISIALANIFRPEDVTREGPRLSDLTTTSAAYGVAIMRHYATVRTSGNIMWSAGRQEIIEVVEEEIGGGLWGALPSTKVTTTTYRYEESFGISLGDGSNARLLKMWFNNKLVHDAVGTGLSFSSIGKMRFHPGFEGAEPDPLMVAIEGKEVPAFQDGPGIIFQDLRLENYNNSIPQISCLMAFDSDLTAPFQELQLLAGAEPPGGDDSNSWMTIRQGTDELYMFKDTIEGISLSTLSDMQMLNSITVPSAGLRADTMTYGGDGFIYGQFGSNNYQRISKIDPLSGEVVGTFGVTGSVATFGDPFVFPNGTHIGMLEIDLSHLFINPSFKLIVLSFNSVLGNGGAAVYQEFTDNNWILFDTNLSIDIGRGGPVMQDGRNRRIYFTQESDTQSIIYTIDVGVSQGLEGPQQYYQGMRQVAVLTKGGTNLAGTADVDAWCMLSEETAVIVSNGISMCRVDLNTGDVTATNLTLGFLSRDQWTNTNLFAFGDDSSDDTFGELIVIDVNDLTEVSRQDVDISDFGDTLNNNHGRGAYDPRNHSLVFSRVNGDTVNDNIIVRVFLERATGNSIPLSAIITDLSVEVGHHPSDLDVTELVPVPVDGFSLTRPGEVRAGIEALQRAFLFDAIESDWMMKFPLRGKAPVLTIPEADLGRRIFDPTKEPVEKVRTQEVELPQKVIVRFANSDNDYQPGAAISQRVSGPVATQRSGQPFIVDLPISMTNKFGKQTSEKLLISSWTERVSLESAMGWKYLRLDPSDVVSIVYDGETSRSRMARLDIGLDMSIDMVATEEDAKATISTVLADGGSGFVAEVLESGLDTQWFPLDIPVLSGSGDGFQQATTMYWVATGYDDTWPGVILFQASSDGGTFLEVGAETEETAWGSTTIALANPDNTITWDDVTTLTLRVRRGLAKFVTKTDLEVMNGENLLLVQGALGPELVQFTTVTDNGDGTITLSRLLRGRLGTEPLSTGHLISERCILLEPISTQPFKMSLSLLNKAVPYRPVTLHGDLDKTKTIMHTHTGQDLIPWSVTDIVSNLSGRTADLTVTWLRRARINGDFLTFVGDVPLDESIESYDVEYNFGGVEIIERLGLTQDSDTVTVAEFIAAGFVTGEAALLNPDFETALSGPWTSVSGGILLTEDPVDGSLTAQSGLQFLWMGNVSADNEVFQEVDLTALGYDLEELDSSSPTVTLNYYHANVETAHVDLTQVIVEFRDASDSVISSLDSGQVGPTPEDTWVSANVSGAMPTLTRKIRVRLLGIRFGGSGVPSVAFDNIELIVGTGVPPLQANFYQNSGIIAIGRGRLATATV